MRGTPENLVGPAVCPHCGLETTVANIARWHGDRCLTVNPDGHEGQNANLNRAAIYIDITTREIRYFGAYGLAAKHYGSSNPAMFGQVLRGNRTQHMGIVPLRLHQFLTITEDELEDLLDNARQARSIARGERGQYIRPDHESSN